jgi:hypothetical protein
MQTLPWAAPGRFYFTGKYLDGRFWARATIRLGTETRTPRGRAPLQSQYIRLTHFHLRTAPIRVFKGTILSLVKSIRCVILTPATRITQCPFRRGRCADVDTKKAYKRVWISEPLLGDQRTDDADIRTHNEHPGRRADRLKVLIPCEISSRSCCSC